MEDDMFSDLIGQAGFQPLTKPQAQPTLSTEQPKALVTPAKPAAAGHAGPREPVLPEPDLLDSALTGSDANGTSQQSHLAINCTQEELQAMVQQVVETALDTTMSKFVRSLRTVLEDMGKRIEATGTAAVELRENIDALKEQLESQGSSMHARFTSVDLAVKEVERGVQSLRDKQELLEAQAMLAKLSTKPTTEKGAEGAQKQPDTPAAAAASAPAAPQAVIPAATAAPQAAAPAAPAASAPPPAAPSTAAPLAPAAVPAPAAGSYAPTVPAVAAPPPQAPPAAPPAAPPQPAGPYAPVAPPAAAPPPPQQQPQQFAPPPPMPYTSQGMSAPPAPPMQPAGPAPAYAQQQGPPPQQPGGGYMSGPASYGHQGPPPGPAGPPPAPMMPPGPPHSMYGPPPGSAGPQYPTPPAGAYPAPFRTGSGPAPHHGGPPPGGRPGPQQQQQPGGPAIQQLSLDKVVNDIVAMGFSHGQVMNVVRQLQSSGQPLEMNVIIDRLMR